MSQKSVVFKFLIVFILTNCSYTLAAPPILEDIRCHARVDCSEPTLQFTALLQRQFPLGTEAKYLESTLLRQGFRRNPNQPATCLKRGEFGRVGERVIQCPNWDQDWNPKNQLEYGWGSLPCPEGVLVSWSVDDRGAISQVHGSFTGGCL